MPRPVTIGGPDQLDDSVAGRLRLAVGSLVSHISYGGVIRVLAGLAARRILHRFLWRRQREALRRLRPVAEPFEPAIALRRSVLTTTSVLGPARLASAEAARRDELERWLTFAGLERLSAVLDRGHGAVLLTSHYGCAHLVPLALVKRGIELACVHRLDLYKHLPADEAARMEVLWLDRAFPARALVEARRRLRQGRPVLIVGDATQGAAVETNFLGRRRSFPLAWASLAVGLGVPVFPVFAPVDEQGRVAVEIGAPLDPGQADEPASSRMESLVLQYVRRLERRWREDPGNVPFERVDRYFSFPVTNAGDGPTERDTSAERAPDAGTDRGLAV